MSKTLILYFHSEHEKSKANAAMLRAAAGLPGVEIVNMYALYPTDVALNVEAEVKRLYTADRLVLQFPIHWYMPPPLLMAWQNHVLTRMFYIHPKEEGVRIEGLPLKVAATAGNVPEAYGPEGVNLFPLEELIHPLHATASRCALQWTEPFLAYRANRLDETELEALGKRYADTISAWTDSIKQRVS